jgi:hypothetical protein
MNLGFTQPLTEMSTRKYSSVERGKLRLARRLKTSPPSGSRLTRKCGILDDSESYRCSRPVIWGRFTFIRTCSYLTGSTPIDPGPHNSAVKIDSINNYRHTKNKLGGFYATRSRRPG